MSKVGFKVAGVLTDLLADQGDCVAEGAAVARLDTREQEARVSRAKSNVEQAKANLDRALAAVTKAEASYANAKSINDRRQALLRKVASDRQAAVICVTHDENIFNRPDRIFRLRDGRLVSVSENPRQRHTEPLAAARQVIF
jgi:multidrug resistance efflux pump